MAVVTAETMVTSASTMRLLVVEDEEDLRRGLEQALREEGCARLLVSDHGAPMPAEAWPRVFDRFYRVDKSRYSAPGVSGLGLVICKAMVEAHGGSIRVESRPGQGTEFQVLLPLCP